MTDDANQDSPELDVDVERSDPSGGPAGEAAYVDEAAGSGEEAGKGIMDRLRESPVGTEDPNIAPDDSIEPLGGSEIV